MHEVSHHFRQVLVVLAILWWSPTAHAETAALKLNWIAPAGCPTAEDVRKEVLRLLAPRVKFTSPIEATARIANEHQGEFVLKLETIQSGIEGERVFTGQTCGAVTDAAVVTLALSLEPNLQIPKDYGTRPLPVEPAEPHSASALPNAAVRSSVVLREPPDPPGTRVARSPSAPKIHGYVRGLVGWRWGSMPESSGELGLGFGLRRSRLSGQLSVSFSPSHRSAYGQQTQTAGGKFSMLAAEVTGCWGLLDGTWRLAPCLGVAFTYLAAQGFGVEPQRDGHMYWTSPQFAVFGGYQLSRLATLYLGVAGSVAIRPPEAYLNESQTIFRPRMVTYQVAGGGEFAIW